jgi:hypothetical protein
VHSACEALLGGDAAEQGVELIARGEILIKSGHLQAGYDTAGSLKWVHGVTLHALLVLPALAWLLAHYGRDEQRRTHAITTAIGLYTLATITVPFGTAVTYSTMICTW